MLSAAFLILWLSPQQPGTGAVNSGQSARVTVAPFGRMPDGQQVQVYTLTNAKGMEVRALSYGAIIQAIRVPDKAGRLGDVTLGYDSLAG